MTHPTDLISLQDIKDAHERIQPFILRSPLIPSVFLSEKVNVPVSLKLECLQPTGSFKLRGAANRLLQLTEEEKTRGVITVSSGNHGKALAYMGELLGVPVTIFLSTHTPACKVESLRKTHAHIIVTGNSYDEADDAAIEYEEKNGLVHVSSFDDLRVIAGQGTMALEILADAPDTCHIIYPLSGGGMGAGIGLVSRQQSPPVQTWGVSMERAPVMVRSLEAGRVLELPEEATLADGLKGGLGTPNLYSFAICREVVNHTTLVSEEEIGQAVAYLFYKHRLVVEGSGAVGVAALLAGKIKPDAPTTVVISGSNINLPTFMELVERYSALF